MDCTLENTGTTQSFIACMFGKQDRNSISLTQHGNGAHHSPCHTAEGPIWEEQSLLPDGSDPGAFLNSQSVNGFSLLFCGPGRKGEGFQKREGGRGTQSLSEVWSGGHQQRWCGGGREWTQEVYDGREQSNLARPCLVLVTPSIHPCWRIFVASGCDNAQQHLSRGPCPARRKRGSAFGGTGSLCESFQPNSCQVCASILPDATAAELPEDGARVIFREQSIAFPWTSVWRGTGGDLAEEFQPPRPVCPVGVFLFGWTCVQKGNIKCWHTTVHVKTS